MAQSTVTVVIVNWNGMEFLPDCLASLAANPPSGEYEVVVVDNLSTDASREWLVSDAARANFGDGNYRVILNGENSGFASANNLAFQDTTGEFILMLNPDTVVKRGAIDRLIQTLSSERRIGAVAPKIINEDGTLQASVGYFPPNPLVIAITEFSLSRLLPKRLRRKFYSEHWEYDEERAVPVIWGAAILAKREMIEQVGGLDEDFFMYGEDVEWCARINRRGWKTVFVPEASIIHLGGKSSEQAWESGETTMRKYAAGIMVERKSLSRSLATCNAVTRLSIHSLVYLKRRITGKHEGLRKRKIKMELRALRDLFAHQR
jgi:GT2 family glycosyltransferase